MRSMILLCAIGFLSSTIAAQNFEIVSSFPANGAFGVVTDSILITFSEPIDIDINTDDLEESGFYGFLEPEESFDFDSLALSNDGKTLKFFGTFTDNTDYLLYIMDAISTSGEHLANPFVMQFSTFDTEGPYSLSGFVYPGDFDTYDLEKHGFIVFLSYNGLEFEFYEPEDEESDGEGNGMNNSFSPDFGNIIRDHDGDNEDEDGLIPIYAALMDTSDFSFSIQGIRDGSYYPYAVNLYEAVEFGEDEENHEGPDDFFFDIFRYDADGDREIDTVYFDASLAPAELPDNILLTYLNLDPYSISEAFEIIESFKIANELTNWSTFGGFAEYKLSYFDPWDNEFETISDAHHGEPLFFEVVDGNSQVWNVLGYDEEKDSVALFVSTPTGAELIDIFGEDETGEDIDFSAVKPLSEFISSENALQIMMDEGLVNAFNSMAFEFGPDFYWDFEFQLLHEYWNYTPDPTPNAPVTWKGTLYGEYYDEFSQTNYYAEYTIHIDPATGDVLYEFATPIPDMETISLIDYVLPDESFDPVEDSVMFVFDGELDIDLAAENPEDMGFQIFISPEDSAEILGINYEATDDGSELTFYVELTDDTDYIVVVEEVNGADGEVLDQPYILQFTTGSADDRMVVSGYLETPDIDINNYYKNVVVMLVDEEPDFGFDFFEDEDDFEESDATYEDHEGDGDDEDFAPRYAANVDPESGFYEINLVREGDYYPIAFDISEDGDDFEGDEFYVPKIFYFDENEDRFPDVLEVFDDEAPDTLNGIDLNQLKFDRFTLSEAIDLADRRFDDLDVGEVEYMGGATFFEFFGFDDGGQGFKKIPTAVIREHEDDGPGTNPFFMADGKNFIWQLFVYHPAKDSVLATFVTPVGAIIEGYLGEEDIDEPINFDLIKPLPENYIDSDSAAIRFAEEGGDDFIEFLEDTYDPGSYSWSHEIQALHEYWDYPFNADPTEPVAWKAVYESYYYDGMTDESFSDTLIIYLDVESGDVLHFELSVDSEFEQEAPDKIQLGQNYPNPFNPSTNIPFELSKASTVNIEVFNLLGQRVATLTNELFAAGRHTIAWNASNYSSGMYFYRLTAGDIIQTKKLMLIK